MLFCLFNDNEVKLLSEYNEGGGIAEVATNADKLDDSTDAIWSLARGLLVADLLRCVAFLLIGFLSYVTYNFLCAVFSFDAEYSMWAVLLGYVVYAILTNFFTNQNPSVLECITNQIERIKISSILIAGMVLIEAFMPIRMAVSINIH